MSITELSLVLGCVLPFAMAGITWLMRVNAKLAVIASRFEELCEKLVDSDEENRQIRKELARYSARLETHELQIAFLEAKLSDIM